MGSVIGECPSCGSQAGHKDDCPVGAALRPRAEVEAADRRAEIQMRQVFERAMGIFIARNATYHDAWKRSGWRGLLFDCRKKIERAWDVLWHADPEKQQDVDDLLDLINYAACAIRAIEENNRDGKGGWW